MPNEQLKLENQICFPLYATSRLLTKAYKPYLDELGLTYPQYLVMLVLWEEDGVPIKHITDRLLLETNTVTPLLKRMENQGLLNRERSQTDERSVTVRLTAAGKQLERSAVEVPGKVMASLGKGKASWESMMQMKGVLCQWMEYLNS